jgi:nucleotide-binding universal stress UspA family protein
MEKIIVATDFSAAATNAARYAADMAATIGAGLVLLHNFEPPALYNEVPTVETVMAMKQEAADGLNRLKSSLEGRAKAPVPIETMVGEGSFFTELKAACESIKPFAVVLGSQGTTAAERFFFGSHTVYALKHLRWPLIAVPKNAPFNGIKNIGLSFDFDKLQETPVAAIKKMVTGFGATLHVLNAGNAATYSADTVHGTERLRLLLGDVKPQYHFITHSDLDEGIIEFAEKNGIDLLLVLPRRHNFIEKLLYTSHTKKLVLHSTVPVMALHP